MSAGEVVAVHPDGSGREQLTQGADLGTFAMSPDGSMFALENSQRQLYVLPVQGDGTPVTLLDPVYDFMADPWTVPAWAPDGKALAIASSSLYGMTGSQLYIVNADGSGLSAIPGVEAASDPAWRPEWVEDRRSSCDRPVALKLALGSVRRPLLRGSLHTAATRVRIPYALPTVLRRGCKGLTLRSASLWRLSTTHLQPSCNHTFEDFRGFSTASAIPQTMEEYREYRQRAMAFIEARNHRIAEYCRLRALADCS